MGWGTNPTASGSEMSIGVRRVHCVLNGGMQGMDYATDTFCLVMGDSLLSVQRKPGSFKKPMPPFLRRPIEGEKGKGKEEGKT